MRALWISVGSVAVALGVIGLVLPIMPTVPFLLLAAFCFGKSSPRLYNRLLDHPIYGPHIRDWQERGAISQSAKQWATVCIAGSLAIAFVLDIPLPLIAAQAAILAAVLIFIWSRPRA